MRSRTPDPEKAIATAERNARIIELRRSGWHWKDIGAEVDLTMGRCNQIWMEYLRDIPSSEIVHWREEELDILGRGIADLLLRLQNPSLSDRTAVEVWKEIRQHSESRRKMLGVDAPVKREIEFVESTSWEAQMRAEIAELEKMNERAAAEANERK